MNHAVWVQHLHIAIACGKINQRTEENHSHIYLPLVLPYLATRGLLRSTRTCKHASIAEPEVGGTRDQRIILILVWWWYWRIKHDSVSSWIDCHHLPRREACWRAGPRQAARRRRSWRRQSHHMMQSSPWRRWSSEPPPWPSATLSGSYPVLPWSRTPPTIPIHEFSAFGFGASNDLSHSFRRGYQAIPYLTLGGEGRTAYCPASSRLGRRQPEGVAEDGARLEALREEGRSRGEVLLLKEIVECSQRAGRRAFVRCACETAGGREQRMARPSATDTARCGRWRRVRRSLLPSPFRRART